MNLLYLKYYHQLKIITVKAGMICFAAKKNHSNSSNNNRIIDSYIFSANVLYLVLYLSIMALVTVCFFWRKL